MKKSLLFIFLLGFLATSLPAISYEGEDMSDHVFVVSEWLPKENYEEELWDFFKELMKITKKNESGCIRAHATRQISHPGAPGKSKFKIVLLQEYVDINAFEAHCNSDHVKNAFNKYMADPETSIIEDWCCRLLSENRVIVQSPYD